MAAKGVEFPVLNSQRFVPVGEVMPAKYHFIQFDQDWFVNTLLPWQNKVAPKQKLQLDQRVTIQLHITRPFFIALYTISCAGVKTRIDNTLGVFNQNAVIPGNTYDDHGSISPEQLTTWQFSFTTGDYMTAGTWYLMVEATFGSDVYQYISEPNEVRADWPQTLLLEYSHPRDEYDIVFSLAPRFCLRLDGFLLNLQVGRETTSFRSEMVNLRQLESHSYRIFELNLGAAKEPIPEYAIDKVRAIMDLENLYIDGKRFVMNNDGDFSITDFRYNAVKPLKIPVVEYYPEDAGKFYRPNTIELFTGGNYPYIISLLRIAGPAGIANLADMKEIMSSTEETAYLNRLNTYFVNLYGLTGTFTKTGDTFYYTNGPGEGYTLARADVYLPLVISVTSSSGKTAALFNAVGTFANETIVSVWTNTGPAINTIPPERYENTGAFTILKTLSTFGIYKIFIYTNDQMTQLYYGSTSTPASTAITGRVFSIMQFFRLRYSSITNMDFGFLRSASLFLQSMDFSRGAITDMTTTGWDTLTTGEWEQLVNISFSFCQLTATAQDRLYNDLWNKVATFYLTAGSVDTRNQTPASAPTGASGGSRMQLLSKGWSLAF